jgi:hypothetical protein
MSHTIHADQLTKVYKVTEREAGMAAALLVGSRWFWKIGLRNDSGASA